MIFIAITDQLDTELFGRETPCFGGSLPVSLFQEKFPVFEKNQFLSIQAIVYENDLRRTNLFQFTNFSGPAWNGQVTDPENV